MKKCPEGGCILLRPGTHSLTPHAHANTSRRIGLSIELPVNLFGRGQATVQSPDSVFTVDIDISEPPSGSRPLFALDGLTVQTVANNQAGVSIYDGSSRLQSCIITGPSFNAIQCSKSDSETHLPPVIINCRCGGRKNRTSSNCSGMFLYQRFACDGTCL